VIGNDVIDLQDDETRAGSQHPRFDARVFDGDELVMLRESADPDRLRWLLWAAKESAYKLLRRTLPDLPFIPRRFVVRTSAPHAATVAASGHVVPIRYDCGHDFVHGVAGCHGAGATLAAVRRIESCRADASSEVRLFAAESIARLIRIESRDLRVDHDGRMPVLLRCGRPLPGTLSLSHHGRYVAFAFAAPDRRGGRRERLFAELSSSSRPAS
jgi:phosphopantetheinyl transferase (holo-ACP synthase)